MIISIAIFLMFINYPLLTILSYLAGGFSTYMTSLQLGTYRKLRLMHEVEMQKKADIGWHTKMFLYFICKWVIIDFKLMVQTVDREFEDLVNKLRSDQDQEE